MKKLMLIAAIATVSLPAAPVAADPPPHAKAHGYREKARAGDWRRYRNYDWNRPQGGAYYADRYYRDGRYYRPYQLTRQSRIYRGRDGRYYCRRSDGTTGLIVGAAVGALLGNAIDRGGSSLAGTLIGGGAGALLGREIDRGGVRCR